MPPYRQSMRLSELLLFLVGYLVVSTVLYAVPTVTLYPHTNLTYRDDDGVCYTYDREPVAC